MVFEKVAKILADYKDVDVSTITQETSFEDLGIDSLDAVEIIMSLEEEFGITIDENASVKSVKEIVDLIESKA